MHRLVSGLLGLSMDYLCVHRYGADEKLLREMLSFVDLPKLHRDEDGTLRVVR